MDPVHLLLPLLLLLLLLFLPREPAVRLGVYFVICLRARTQAGAVQRGVRLRRTATGPPHFVALNLRPLTNERLRKVAALWENVSPFLVPA